MTDKIVSFSEIKTKKSKEDAYELDYQKHDNILDVLESEYPMGGIIITLTEDGVGVAATVDDYETLRNAIVAAMIKVLENGSEE